MPEINDIFGAKPSDVLSTLTERGRCFYIPAYQREYSWDSTKTVTLFKDAMHGLTQLIDRDDACTFIGTLITIKDINGVTVHPLVKLDLPAAVMTVIDGQQRLTSLILANIALHEFLTRFIKKFDSSTDPADQWLHRQTKDLCLNKLPATFEEDMQGGQGAYYPRIIRAFHDCWSYDEDLKQYVTPIARFVHTYGNYTRRGSGAFKYDVPEKAGKEESDHKFLDSAYKKYKNLIIREIATDSGNTFKFPEISKVLSSPNLQVELFRGSIPDEVKDKIKNESADPIPDFERLFRVIVFTNYWLKKVAITFVQATSEDYAFDMFEALNTTGDPLTAFETFVPRVVQAEGLDKYRQSESYTHIEQVKNYVGDFKTVDQRQKQTAELLTSFALLEKGSTLSKKLSDQRRHLSKWYNELGNISKQREFTQSLADLTLFLTEAWPRDTKYPPKFDLIPKATTEETQLCLDLLRKHGHTITIAPLTRFYSNAIHASDEDKSEKIDAFVTTIKAITAFSVLWRMAHSSTAAVDSHFRNLMSEGFEVLQPLARDPDGKPRARLSTDKLREALRNILKLEGGITDKSTWVTRASKIDAYKQSQPMTKFLLLAAANDTLVDSTIGNEGLVKRGTAGILDCFTYKQWQSDDAFTIEHIAPQEKVTLWADDLYEEPGTIHRLGNLALMPASLNSVMGTKRWAEKKVICSICACKSKDEVETKITGSGETFSETAEAIFNRKKFHPHLEAISNVDEWDLEIIEKRSENIASLAWDTIYPWLET